MKFGTWFIDVREVLPQEFFFRNKSHTPANSKRKITSPAICHNISYIFYIFWSLQFINALAFRVYCYKKKKITILCSILLKFKFIVTQNLYDFLFANDSMAFSISIYLERFMFNFKYSKYRSDTVWLYPALKSQH